MRLIAAIQTSDWIFNARVLTLSTCNSNNKGDAMAEKWHAAQDVPVPDLLAALTAYGLGSSRLSPPTENGAWRSWLERCVKWIFARDDAVGAALGSPNLD